MRLGVQTRLVHEFRLAIAMRPEDAVKVFPIRRPSDRSESDPEYPLAADRPILPHEPIAVCKDGKHFLFPIDSASRLSAGEPRRPIVDQRHRDLR